MDRKSLVAFGGQLVVVGLDGKLRTLIENEQSLQGEVIVARNDAEPIGLNVHLVKENGVQDVSDDVAQILGALEAGQDPTQLGDEFASAVGQSYGSSLQASEAVDSLLANNEIGLEADGDNLILTISESDGSSSQKVVIEGGSNQYSELLIDGSLSPADGSAILNDLLKINNDIT